VYVESEKKKKKKNKMVRTIDGDVRATAFDGEGRQNIGGDLVITSITSDSCHLDY
jgi:hypothetical protein